MKSLEKKTTSQSCNIGSTAFNSLCAANLSHKHVRALLQNPTLANKLLFLYNEALFVGSQAPATSSATTHKKKTRVKQTLCKALLVNQNHAISSRVSNPGFSISNDTHGLVVGVRRRNISNICATPGWRHSKWHQATSDVAAKTCSKCSGSIPWARPMCSVWFCVAGFRW